VVKTGDDKWTDCLVTNQNVFILKCIKAKKRLPEDLVCQCCSEGLGAYEAL